MCLVSGSGNVSQYTIEKLLDLGAKPVTVSDSDGAIYDADGIDRDKLAFVMELKNNRRGRIQEYTEQIQEGRISAPPIRSRPQLAVEHQGRLRVPERHPE